MSDMLHIVNKSPSERPALASCLRLAMAGSSVLLIEDGVYAALLSSSYNEQLKARGAELKLYVLGPDLQARGLLQDELIHGFKIIDYAGFVDLVTEHPTNQSWL